MIVFFDSHAHLNDNKFSKDFSEAIARAKAVGVNYILNVGYDLASSRRALEIAKANPHNYAALGVHPHNASMYSQEVQDVIEHLSAHQKVVAIGEIGLDYYRNLSPKGVQQDAFRKQINLAKKLGKPIIIHDRDAHQDVMDILKEELKGEVKVVMHCFSGSVEMAKECVKRGYYISLAGPVTYPNAVKPVEVAKYIPTDRLLVETDCPYLTPQPERGKRNEPAYVRYVAEKIAELRKCNVEEVAYRTTRNAMEVFNVASIK